MQLVYGSYSFQANSCAVSARTAILRNKAGVPYIRRSQIQVSGDLLDTGGAAALTTLENDLRSALATNYQDLIFKDNSGANTSTALINSDSLSGVIIIDGPHFTLRHGTGPEYVSTRAFEFTAEADFALANTMNLLTDFRESLTFSGGGPYFAMKRAVNGIPQRQMIYPATEYVVIQAGQASHGVTVSPQKQAAPTSRPEMDVFLFTIFGQAHVVPKVTPVVEILQGI